MPLPLPAGVDTHALERIAAEYGTPFQLYDEDGIQQNARTLVQTFRSAFPDFKQFFAVKALPNPSILRVLAAEGVCVDVSSTAELHVAHLLGFRGEDIMYTSNYTSAHDLAVAYDQGVIINLDDISLVQSLVRVRGRVPDLICFRLNPGLGRTDSETASNVLGGPDAKFGVPLSDIVDAYRAARAAGAKRFGMHMMTGSCVLNSEYWKETVTVLLDAVARVHQELGIQFEFINIGGGLGVPYRPGQERVDVPALAASLKDVVAGQVEKHRLPFRPAIFMENGRYMTGPFGWLVSRCEAVKHAYGSTYYGLDACMSNLMRPGMYGSYHHITVPKREASGPEPASRHNAHVVGTLCENNDWFAKSRDLPAAQVGDLFVIHDTGAHSHSMGFQYNGKLRAPELLLRRNGRVDVIRERESVHCLFDNCIVPADLDIAERPFPYAGRAAPPDAATHTPTCTTKIPGDAALAAAPRSRSSIQGLIARGSLALPAAALAGAAIGAALVIAWHKRAATGRL